MESNLDGLLTQAERQAIHDKLAVRRPITQAETKRLLEHIEILEMVLSLKTVHVHPV